MNLISYHPKLPCVFFSYSSLHKGYLCYDPHSRKIRISWNVVFREHIKSYISIGKSPKISESILPSFDTQKSAKIDDDDIQKPLQVYQQIKRINQPE